MSRLIGEALEQLKELNEDISAFIFDWIDEIESLSSKWPVEKKNKKQTELEF